MNLITKQTVHILSYLSFIMMRFVIVPGAPVPLIHSDAVWTIKKTDYDSFAAKPPLYFSLFFCRTYQIN